MVSKKILEEVLQCAMATGADYAEIYMEHTNQHSISMCNDKVEKITDTLISGAGIRAWKGTKSVNGATSVLSRESLISCAKQVAEAIGAQNGAPDIYLTEQIFPNIHPVKIVPSTAEKSRKIEILKDAYFAAKGYHADISQVEASVLDVDHKIWIATSEGLYTNDRRIRTRMRVEAVASKNGENQSGTFAPGSRQGLEFFEEKDPKEIGKKAAQQAMVLINAGYCPAGTMPVAIENGYGGVIFHEACGHSLEAASVALGQSQFTGRLGQQIANEKVTAIDDGTIPNGWGSIDIDDEGTPAQRNVLIENGILKTYMVDKLNGRRMGLETTGNSRRQGYQYPPTSRMTNTFLDNGPDKNEDIIASIDNGLYAKSMGGGSVNPVTGEFNFAVTEGYLVKNGKITEPVRGASLIGKGSEILMNIDMVGQNLDRAQGMCGASSGSIPTDVGQPLVRVSSITVGGR
ncbi:MAG: TldD/PmbA family protein [Eubacterium sp.]|nr:TldD/PmbA family protein [Eubacterium sp.]